MLALQFLTVLASLAVATPVPAGSSAAPKPSSTSVSIPPPAPLPSLTIPPPAQRWHFLTPTVEYSPYGRWKTSNVDAHSEPGAPSNATVRGASSGITIEAVGRASDVKFYIDGIEEQFVKDQPWGKDAKIQRSAVTPPPNGDETKQEFKATVSGLAYGFYEYTLGSKDQLTFRSAEAVTKGADWSVFPREPTPITKAEGIVRQGQWEDLDGTLRTSSKGAKLVVTPPLGTGLLELSTGQPAVPFGDFKVTVNPRPAPALGPRVEKVYDTLQSSPVQLLIYNAAVPIHTVVLDPKIQHTITYEYIGEGAGDNGQDTFAISDVTYFP